MLRYSIRVGLITLMTAVAISFWTDHQLASLTPEAWYWIASAVGCSGVTGWLVVRKRLMEIDELQMRVKKQGSLDELATRNKEKTLLRERDELVKGKGELVAETARLQEERKALRAAVAGGAQGMPTLLKVVVDYLKMQDNELVRSLRHDGRSPRALDTARAMTENYRIAYKDLLQARIRLELYEALFPVLKDCGQVPVEWNSWSQREWMIQEAKRLDARTGVKLLELQVEEAKLERGRRELAAQKELEESQFAKRLKELERQAATEAARAIRQVELETREAHKPVRQLLAEHQQEREQEKRLVARTLADTQREREQEKRLVARALADTQREREALRQVAVQRNAALPTMLRLLEELAMEADGDIVQYLRTKQVPALAAAEQVRVIAAQRRAAEKQARYVAALLEYYEQLAPFLLDFREEMTAERTMEEEEQWQREYSDEEREDEATKFLTKEEYRKLTPAQRSDKALERYWTRRHSPQEVGRMYERYIGYLYEKEGFRVEYHGILYGREDLGRDLLCYGSDGRTRVVQCKWWSQHKTIHEKHLFQLYGSLFLYQRQLHQQGLFDAQGVFVTTTQLSDVAREAAHFLRIEVSEQKPMDKGYPCIKCNISRTGEKIYHLPFDQQYDKTQIIAKNGEMYCKTAAEAEKKGFRRALRYRPE